MKARGGRGGRTVAEVAVLGAGPAGLGAAYRLAAGGHEVVVLEGGARVGGAAGSFEVGGIRVDHGSHRLHPSIDPSILAELRTLLGEDLQRRRRNGRIRLGGRWVAFPLRTFDLARNLPPGFLLAAARDAALSWARRARADTFEEVLLAGLGRTMCERFYFPYARKLWGLEPDEISGEQARRRVSAGSPTRVLARLLSPRDPAAGSFYYPRRGFGQISERLAEAAGESGADIRLGAAAEAVEVSPGGVRVLIAGGGVVEARRLWSTIPLTALARLVDPPPRAQVLHAAAGLAFRSMLLVYLVLEGGRFTPYDAHYLPEPPTPITRLSEPTNYRDGDDPPDRTVLCAEIPCAAADPMWTATAGELGELVAGTLRAAGLPAPAPAEVEVRRLSHAYPIYRVGYEEAFSALDAWAASLPGVLTFGRQGLFAHDNTHHALAMAWAAAESLDEGGGFDEEAWIAARRRFTSHVVED